MQLLQTKRRIIRMPHHQTRGLPLRAVHALVHLQHVASAKMNLRMFAIDMLPAVIADDLHLQPSRLDLAIVAVLDRALDCRRGVIVQLSTLVRSRTRDAPGCIVLVSLVRVAFRLISLSSASAPAGGEVESGRWRGAGGTIACPATACRIGSEVVGASKGST